MLVIFHRYLDCYKLESLFCPSLGAVKILLLRYNIILCFLE